MTLRDFVTSFIGLESIAIDRKRKMNFIFVTCMTITFYRMCYFCFVFKYWFKIIRILCASFKVNKKYFIFSIFFFFFCGCFDLLYVLLTQGGCNHTIRFLVKVIQLAYLRIRLFAF